MVSLATRVDRATCLPFIYAGFEHLQGSLVLRSLLNYLPRAARFTLVLLAVNHVAAAPPSVSAAAQPAIFAKVGDSVITQDEYAAAFNMATRAKFYHGKPPDNEIALMQREVGEQLVARILLLHEAKQRGLRADANEIQKTVQSYDQRYAKSEQWKKNRAQQLPALIARLEQENLLSQLETTIRARVKPNEQQVKTYYAAHPPQFTEPEQMRVSVILLKVDPSASAATWTKTSEQAQALAKRARAGEDFAALARQHSADPSAKQGGDMGYLHSGMLPDEAQKKLAKMQVRQITDSVRLLPGFAVFQLTGRKAAQLHSFDEVKVRAQQLAQRERGDSAWAAFIAELKAKTPVQVDQSHFLPLAKSTNAS